MLKNSSPAVFINISKLATKFSSESITPFGSPVVPLEKGIIDTSLGDLIDEGICGRDFPFSTKS